MLGCDKAVDREADLGEAKNPGVAAQGHWNSAFKFKRLKSCLSLQPFPFVRY